MAKNPNCRGRACPARVAHSGWRQRAGHARPLQIFAFLLGALVGLPALAQEFAPAIIFDMGGKFDKSFNEAAYAGAERFKKETGTAYREFEITNETQREQALSNMVKRGGSIIVSV